MESRPDAYGPELRTTTRPRSRAARRRAVQLRQLVVCLSAILLLRVMILDWQDISSGSMTPTLLTGDRVFVSRVAYDLRLPWPDWRIEIAHPELADIVVFPNPLSGERTIKRVVGLPGDTIEVRAGRLIRNGVPVAVAPIHPDDAVGVDPELIEGHELLTETISLNTHSVMVSTTPTGPDRFGPFVVPPKTYFVMGDNRDHSSDSRAFGVVQRNTIRGKAIAIVASFETDVERGPGMRGARFWIPLR